MPSERRIRIFAWVLLVAMVLLGSIQGARIQTLREHEAFYRWIVAAASAVRLGDSLEPDQSADVPEARDDELFAEVDTLAAEVLSGTPVDPSEDITASGETLSPLIRAVRQEADWDVYQLAASSEAQPLRQQFMEYRNEGRLQSLGTRFQTANLYDEGGQAQGVGLTSLFFGFRKLAANFLWLQVDTFWHAGEVHRLLPLMRTCVALDPQFIDAYLVGSWHLAYNLTAKLDDTPEPQKEYDERYGARVGPKERWYYIAIEFLKDGARKNPRDYRIYFDLGFSIYAEKLNDHENAVLYLKEARRHAHDRWVPRMLYRSQWLNGDYNDAMDGWRDYLEDFPGNDTAQRFLKINQASLHQERYEQFVMCAYRAREAAAEARENGDTAAAEEADKAAENAAAEAAKEREASLALWQELYEADQRDTLAYGRLLLHSALDLVAQGRDHEARAALETARFEVPDFFFEVNDMIIEIKQNSGIGLSVSERAQVMREEEAAGYTEPKPRKMYIECDYLDPYDDLTIIEALHKGSSAA